MTDVEGRAAAPATTADGRAASAFRAIAVFGVIAGLVLGTTAWIFLSDLDDNLDQSLAIGESASGSVIETIDVAEQLIEALELVCFEWRWQHEVDVRSDRVPTRPANQVLRGVKAVPLAPRESVVIIGSSGRRRDPM